MHQHLVFILQKYLAHLVTVDVSPLMIKKLLNLLKATVIMVLIKNTFINIKVGITGWMKCRQDSLEKLKYLNQDLKIRNKIAPYYMNNINNTLVTLPHIPSNVEHAWYLFVIKLHQSLSRKKLQNHLKSHNIETGIHYPVAIHKQKAYFEYK